ncbi:MAG TPA: protein phosphatase 2C domain-containing protein [Gemmatimonadales bacterium]|nr:protein phosphatase 2C domain-containing protein [Gemmatimonadales bacterium]
MALPELRTVTLPIHPGERPRDDELDLFGVTHRGKVRKENQDHFLLATLHRQMVVHGTSLPDADWLRKPSERLATVMLVADGVGGGHAGGDASRLATETAARYVRGAMQCFHASGTANEAEFQVALRAAALEAHEAVRSEAEGRGQAAGQPGAHGFATTLTLGIAVWPWLHVVQVGDSRCYLFDRGVLRQITRDQTVAQELVDKGVLKADRAAESPLSHVLSSSIGGHAAVPEVSCIDIRRRGCVVLLCSDGLTKHVEDAEIASRAKAMESSEQLCRDLLDLALERGGTDNITVISARARVPA